VPLIFDKVEVTSLYLINQTETVINETLTLAQYYPITVPEVINTIYSDADKIKSEILDHRSDVDAVELARNIFVIVLYAAVIISCLFGLIAALFGWGAPALCMVVLLWFFLVVTALNSGVHLSVSVTTADVCQTVDTYLLSDFFDDIGVDNDTSEVVRYYLFCNTPLPAELVQYSNDANAMAIYADGEYVRARRNNNTQEMQKWAMVLNETMVLRSNLITLFNCNGTAQTYNYTKEEICTDVLLGTFLIMATELVTCVVGLAVLIVGLLGFKRFPRRKGKYEEQGGYSLSDEREFFLPRDDRARE